MKIRLFHGNQVLRRTYERTDLSWIARVIFIQGVTQTQYIYIYVYKSFWAGFITFQLENQFTNNKTLHYTKTLYYMGGKHHPYYKTTF